MNTNEKRFTARQWLERTLPTKGFWHHQTKTGFIMYHYDCDFTGIRYCSDGKVDSPCSIVDKLDFPLVTITRSTAIDMMVKAIEGEAGDVTPSPYDCCKGWATDDLQTDLLGNGHHHKCPHFKKNVGAVDLLTRLVKGIKWWADQEDGVPDEVWAAYKDAVVITEGRILDDAGDATPKASDDPYAHLPHGGWWCHGNGFLFFWPNETDRGKRFTLDGKPHHGASVDGTHCNEWPFSYFYREGKPKLTREQVIAIIEQNRKATTPAKVDDGGPAYPIPSDGVTHPTCTGMSLREHYAGLAMQGLIAHMDCSPEGPSIVELSVSFADALIAELRGHQ